MKKTVILVVIAVVVVLAVVAVFITLSKLDSLVATGIERAGTHVAGTKVSVGGVDISIREGRGSIKGLEIANPAGFSDRNVFGLGEVTIDVDVESIRSQDPIVIEAIYIAAPEILFELDKNGKTNVDAIRKHAESVVVKSSGGSSGSGETDEGPPILVRSIKFEEGKIAGDGSAVGVDPFEIKLPSFTLTDVGGSGGVPAAQIGKIIMMALTRNAAEAVAQNQASDVLKDQLNKTLGEKSKGFLDR